MAFDITPAVDNGANTIMRPVVCARDTAVVGVDFDLALVVQFKHFAKRKTHRMFTQIRRQVTDADALSSLNLLADLARGKSVMSGRPTSFFP